MSLPVEIRGLREEDIPFIMNSWLRTWRNKPEYRWCSNMVYWSEFSDHCFGRLKRGNMEVRVACSPKDKDFIYGFSLAENKKYVFSYIKQTFRLNNVKEKLYEGIEGTPEGTNTEPSKQNG